MGSTNDDRSGLPRLAGFVSDETPEDREYLLQLGRFVEQFAMMETVLFAYIAEVAGVPDPVLRIVSAGWRAGSMVTFIRNLWRVNPPPSSAPDLAIALTQFSHIEDVRNKILHNASQSHWQSELRIKTNYGRHMPTKAPIAYGITASLLDDLTFDLGKILAHFASFLSGTADLELRRGAPLVDEPYRTKLPLPNVG
jgi:hypothetical protein